MEGLKALSHVYMVPLVREILRGKDLSQVTPRTVREEVISRLGDEATSDLTALKAAVKSALDIVLTDAIDEQEPGNSKPPAEEKHDIHSRPLNGASARSGDEEADVEDDTEQRDDDRGFYPGDEDEEQALPRKWVGRAKSESQQRPKKRARATVEQSSVFNSEKDFKRLKKVCWGLGCTTPPSRQKGSTMREKCSNVLSYLRSKGVMDCDPTRLRKVEIDAHKRRIEREMDLEGLDVRNIIEEEGRPKRRRADVTTASKNEEFPSDLSGLDMSEKSEDDDEEFALSDADSE